MRSWVEVSLGTIRANYRAVRAVVGDHAEIMPVVKADAYRHGALEVSRALEAEGAQWLAVSNVEEGVALRQAGIRTRILVMADFLPAERAALVEFNLTPVVHSLYDIPLAQGPYHLKVDSGMGRLGTRADARRNRARGRRGTCIARRSDDALRVAGQLRQSTDRRSDHSFRTGPLGSARGGACAALRALRRYDSRGVSQDGGLGQPGASWACHLRIRLAGARRGNPRLCK